jgi:hypothetical protein
MVVVGWESASGATILYIYPQGVYMHYVHLSWEWRRHGWTELSLRDIWVRGVEVLRKKEIIGINKKKVEGSVIIIGREGQTDLERNYLTLFLLFTVWMRKKDET